MSFSESQRPNSDQLDHPDQFVRRHIGPNANETAAMLKVVGYDSVNALTDAAVPKAIRLTKPLDLPQPSSEYDALRELKSIAAQNQVFRSFIGQGYYDCITPPVIQRNVLENPGWYTQYTPYQAEISQGRLEALLNFQTMAAELTDLDIANASMLDEATAAAEAMTMSHRLKDGRNVFFISETCHPQTIEVVSARAKALGIEFVVGSAEQFEFSDKVFGALVQYPDTFGAIHNYEPFVEKAHAAGAMVTVATDLLALTLIKPPGEFGADIAVGSAQRFGVPLGYGGPHAAFFATRDELKRQMPGRIVGVSKDARGKPAMRLALGTREQHIRREKATSNICTAQALLANMASLYACYHGAEGLKKIAERVHKLTVALAEGLWKLGYDEFHHAESNRDFFDTLSVLVKPGAAKQLLEEARQRGINLREFPDNDQCVGISLDETTSTTDVVLLWEIFAGKKVDFTVEDVLGKDSVKYDLEFPAEFKRTSNFLQHPVFNRYHSETEMLRYIKRLESRDLSLTASMIPLGSCTMKLNAAAEMFPVSWPEFAKIHPFAPIKQTRGYQKMFEQLETWLAEITGFAGISLQPNAGSQGEYAGLLVIRAYHESRGEAHRNVCLIPTSAHGTNPASAVMAGMKVVAVACDTNGNIDVADLRAKADAHKNDLSCLMITYPSTHGVFEETIREICDIIHAHGGQVYMDGANMNAQVGLTSPGHIGADVCHLNLHKTFCIPHGGGGPGVGPIGVAAHLVEFLPGHNVVNLGGESPIGAVSAAPWGSASILTISWMYIAMMGADGLTEATKFAILNANYISKRLEKHFPTLYKNHTNHSDPLPPNASPSPDPENPERRGLGGRGCGLVAHECILDLRAFKGTTAEDVAKRLMDYGFHAPTLSWPVAGTLMVEPTESESQYELDRFCNAMISIHAEMTAVENGSADAKNNVLKNAPHTADQIASDAWNRPYSREAAAFPAKSLHDYKFWPPVARVDNVFGDRNPVCSCVGMENYS